MTQKRIEISKDFKFEAAHYFEHKPDGHPFKNLHGHSFEGSVTLSGPLKDDSGWVKDFWKIEETVGAVVSKLDHTLLNDVEGLDRVSLEAIAAWVFDRLENDLPGLVAVEIRRPSCGERAVVKLG
ncbi:MAG: 6-pyruvoyl tetrahydropterin synthase family protein [Euryhalocaulis sp.]|uniref:6-pyruvoyl trahydropterin synthase family protein n=1 Tax=Euryhalocaulis sp. TaxID=2744307 RepID=UPI0017CDBE1B|nr:6-carboxytetrahydropterin synthase [Euryhalocaulis sp.]MBA4801634.1 6-pyruvoyl tetrahydropterin synthase family protein [Euryhalocaulis sp.]